MLARRQCYSVQLKTGAAVAPQARGSATPPQRWQRHCSISLRDTMTIEFTVSVPGRRQGTIPGFRSVGFLVLGRLAGGHEAIKCASAVGTRREVR